jgi:hypothetical protein
MTVTRRVMTGRFRFCDRREHGKHIRFRVPASHQKVDDGKNEVLRVPAILRQVEVKPPGFTFRPGIRPGAGSGG